MNNNTKHASKIVEKGQQSQYFVVTITKSWSQSKRKYLDRTGKGYSDKEVSKPGSITTILSGGIGQTSRSLWKANQFQSHATKYLPKCM